MNNENSILTTSKKASMKLALDLVAQAFAVFPLYANKKADGNAAFTPKTPAIKAFGTNAATTPEEVRDMWNGTNESGKNAPDKTGKKNWRGLREDGVYGVAISCKKSKLVVLDIDTAEHGKDGMASLHAIKAKYGDLPKTRTTRTGSGGLHMLFKQAEGVIIPSSASKIGDGIDVKSGTNKDGAPEGHGGYFVAPGNVFEAPDGIRSYEVIDDSPIADLPEQYIELLRVKEEAPQPAPAGTRIFLEALPQTDQDRLEKWSRQAIQEELETLATSCKGERNDTLNNVALRCIRIAMNGSIKGQPHWLRDELTQAALQAGLSMQEASKTIGSAARKAKTEGAAYPKDYSPVRTAQAQVQTSAPAGNAAPASQQTEEWPALVEYGTTGEKKSIAPLMPYLPAVIRDFCAGLAQSVQVPLEMCFAMLLPAISTCVHDKVKVHVFGDYYEPVNVYTLCAMPPSNGKSPVVKACTKPLREWEKKKREEMKHEVEMAEHQFEMAQNRIGKLKLEARDKDSSTTEGKRQIEKILKEIDELTLNMPEVPTIPRLLVDDITPEKLASVMAEQHGKIGMITAEGGIFDILAGMYSTSGAANIQIVLKGWTGGEAYTVDRISRDAVILENPIISMGINVQPGLIQKRQAAERFRMSGLDARFLYFVPDSLLGYRDAVPEIAAVPTTAKNAYHALIHALLNMPYDEGGEPHILELSPEAMASRNKFFSMIEVEMRPGGQFDEMQDWAGKIPGGAVRLAGLLHLAGTRGDLTQKVISGETMQTAVLIARLLCQHAKLAYEILGNDEKSLDAQKVLKWIQGKKLESFTASECQQKFKDTTGLKDNRNREAALRDLEERFYIREVPQVPTGKRGAPKSPKYQVNPAFFAGKSGENQ